MIHKTTLRQFASKSSRYFKTAVILFACIVSAPIFSQSKQVDQNDKILNEYINSQGYQTPIIFDASNIKQFWVSNLVSSRDNLIHILLNKNEKDLFKIQLANVIETQDCRIDVISETPGVSFSIYDSSNNLVAQSALKEDFIQYHVYTSLLNLENTSDFSFYLSFAANELQSSVSIKKIVLSFSKNENSHFAGSPGFEKLLDQIDNDGIAVANNADVKYIFDKENKKFFIKVPNELVDSNQFFYHTWPSDSKDLLPDRTQYGFNSSAFSTKRAYLKIPSSPHPDINYSIVQMDFPAYDCSSIQIGQHQNGKYLWDFDPIKQK